jgi:hypothetical protein
MIGKMAAVAVECTRAPGKKSVWSERLQRFVCEDEAEFNLVRDQPHQGHVPAISPKFKLVFLTAAGGTLFFFLVCIGMHIAMGKAMSPPLTQIIDRTFDLVKIGFGAVVGMLGSKALD